MRLFSPFPQAKFKRSIIASQEHNLPPVEKRGKLFLKFLSCIRNEPERPGCVLLMSVRFSEEQRNASVNLELIL